MGTIAKGWYISIKGGYNSEGLVHKHQLRVGTIAKGWYISIKGGYNIAKGWYIGIKGGYNSEGMVHKHQGWVQYSPRVGT